MHISLLEQSFLFPEQTGFAIEILLLECFKLIKGLKDIYHVHAFIFNRTINFCPEDLGLLRQNIAQFAR